MQLTVTGIGAIVSLLVMLLFSGIRILETRRQKETELTTGDLLNAAGFGLLPCIAVWKIFERGTILGTGTECFEPIGEIPLITAGGRFAPSAAEMILAAACFAGIILWLILRKDELPGNGDLLLTVLCVWGLIRAFTEGFRETALLRTGSVNLTQILLLLAADIPLAVWTVRMEASQKSTAFSVLEWIAVLSCEAVLVLNTMDILSAGSRIGDLAVNAGCVILSMLLTLAAGKDSRS